MKLSFVIPVYNVEKYLRECVDSILNQMTNECEIILVDDGSTDSSGKICDEYVRTNGNISVIHNENRGVSAARNMGLDTAKGEYIAFIDSDDRIADGSVKGILQRIDSDDCFDVCFMQTIKFYPNGRREELCDGIYRKDIEDKNLEEVYKFLRTRSKYSGSASNKIYNRMFLKDNKIQFAEDGRFCEDLGFVRDCIIKAKRFAVLDFPYYEYRQDVQTSRSYEFSFKKFCDMFYFVEETADKRINDANCLTEIDKTILSFASYEYAICLWKLVTLEETEYEEAKKMLKKYKWVLKFGENNLIKTINLMTKIVGLRLTSYIITLYKNK